MPYEIRKVEGGYCVFNKETGERKNKKPDPSKEAAMPYMRALYSKEPAGEKLAEVSGRKK